jgi:hypothetical protein
MPLPILLACSGLLMGACASPPLAVGPTEPVERTQAVAPHAAASAAPAATDAQPDGVIEEARGSVRSTAEWLASSVDSWFGDKPFTQGGSVTQGRLSLAIYKRQDEHVNVGLRFNARFHLPNLEDRTYLFVGRDNTRDIITDQPATFSRQQRLLRETSTDRSFFAGLGKALDDAIDLRLGLRGGLKPYAQARYRRPWSLGPVDLVEFRETVFWSVDDHVGSTTAFSYEHAFTSALAARWLNALTITQVTQKFEWHSSLGLFKSVGAQRLFWVEALASGMQGSGIPVSDYGLQAHWEQPVHKDWLLGEIVVGHFWPRPDVLQPRGRAWALGAGLKLGF